MIRLSTRVRVTAVADAWTPGAQPDVDEALRLMRMSKVSLFDDEAHAPAADPVSAVYGRLRDDAQRTRRETYTWADLLALLGQSFSVRARPGAP